MLEYRHEDKTGKTERRYGLRPDFHSYGQPLFGYETHLRRDEDSITLSEPETGRLVTLEKMKFIWLWMSYDDMWYPEKDTDIKLR